MKIKFLALGLAATLAGVASVDALRSPIAQTASLPLVAEQAQPPSTALPDKISAPTARSALASESGRAPVPVLLSHRREFVPVVAAASVSSPSSPTSPNADAATPAKISETAAKAAIEGDGYKGVRALARGADGAWKGIALRGQTEVSVRVDPTGNVSVN